MAVAVVGILVGWSALSWQQAKIWRNGITLWGWAESVHRDFPGRAQQPRVGLGSREGVPARRGPRAPRGGRLAQQSAVLQTLGRIVAAQRRYDESA